MKRQELSFKNNFINHNQFRIFNFLTVMQVTDNHEQIMIAVNKENLTCEIIRKSGIFSIFIVIKTMRIIMQECNKHY